MAVSDISLVLVSFNEDPESSIPEREKSLWTDKLPRKNKSGQINDSNGKMQTASWWKMHLSKMLQTYIAPTCYRLCVRLSPLSGYKDRMQTPSIWYSQRFKHNYLCFEDCKKFRSNEYFHAELSSEVEVLINYSAIGSVCF